MSLKEKIIKILPIPNDELLNKERYVNGFPIDWRKAQRKINEKLAIKIIKLIKERKL